MKTPRKLASKVYLTHSVKEKLKKLKKIYKKSMAQIVMELICEDYDVHFPGEFALEECLENIPTRKIIYRMSRKKPSK